MSKNLFKSKIFIVLLSIFSVFVFGVAFSLVPSKQLTSEIATQTECSGVLGAEGTSETTGSKYSGMKYGTEKDKDGNLINPQDTDLIIGGIQNNYDYVGDKVFVGYEKDEDGNEITDEDGNRIPIYKSFIEKTISESIVVKTAGSSTRLTLGKDYTLVYSKSETYTKGMESISPVGVGTYYVHVVGKGNYSGVVSLSYEITPAQLTTNNIIFSGINEKSFVYDGLVHTPATASNTKFKVEFKKGDGTYQELVLGTDFTADKGFAAVGDHKVTITAKSANFTGSLTSTEIFTITPSSITDTKYTITLSSNSAYYDGKDKKPTVTITDTNNTKLTLNTDYTVKYLNSSNVETQFIDAGTYEVRVTGIGNYGNTTDIEFNVLATDITDAVITLSDESFVYDGELKSPKITSVTINGARLVDGKYTTNIVSGRNAGTYAVTVTGDGTNYINTATKNYTITKRDMTGVNVTLTPGQDLTYTGNHITPTVIVKDPSISKTLTSTDYDVIYQNNIDVARDASNNNVIAGGKIVITGKGNYQSSTITQTFTIQPRNISTGTLVLSYTTIDYNGAVQTPTATVTLSGYNPTFRTEYSPANPKDVGNYTVTVTGNANFTGTLTQTYTITQESIKDATVIIGGTYTYDGTAQTPQANNVTVKLGEKQLISGTDYTFNAKDNTNAGTATITITGQGNYTGTATKTFKISKKSINDATVTIGGEYTYNGIAQTP